MSEVGARLPDCIFMVRVRNENIGGANPYEWATKTTSDYFAGKRVILFSLPGAFTPTCSTNQLPGFENNYDRFNKEFGIDEIYCMSVNDAFTMNAWAEHKGIKKVKMIPDGNGQFTFEMGMLVEKMNFGFGQRSWRYAAIIDDGIIEAWFEEPGICDDCETDPYFESSPEAILQHFQEKLNNQT
jgi:peroxiredoxin